MSVEVKQDPDLVEVRLLGFPLALQAASEEHHEELLREFAHVAHTADDGSGRVPERLLSLVADLRERYAPFTGPVRDEMEAARMQGRASVDLVYRVPASVGASAQQLADLLEEADEFCRRGDLLTLATGAQMVIFRRWVLEEFGRQVEGAEPQPWAASRGSMA